MEAAVASAPIPDVSDAEVALTDEPGPPDPTDIGTTRNRDPSAAIRQAAINALAANTKILNQAASEEGVPWMAIQAFLASTLPPEVVGSLVPDPNDWAYKLVGPALNELFGPEGWRRGKKPSKKDASVLVTYVWTTSNAATPAPSSQGSGPTSGTLFDDEDP